MEREESTCRTCFGRRCEYFNGCPLSNWYPGSDHSFIPPSLAPESQKSGSPTTGFREREKEASTWDEPLARAHPQTAPSGPRTKTANRPACDDSWTDRQGIIPRFLFPILTQHVACRMSYVTCRRHGQASQAAHQRLTTGSSKAFICGSVTLTCRWPRSSSPILLIFLHLWFHLALFRSACPDFRFHQEPPYLLGRPRRMPDCFLNWPLCPLPVSNSSLGRTPTMAPG